MQLKSPVHPNAARFMIRYANLNRQKQGKDAVTNAETE